MSPSADAQPQYGKEVKANMAVRGGPEGVFHQPIHESLTLAALISGGFDVAHGTTLDGASNSDWEYVRGAIWNDDPAGLLFEDTQTANHTYSTGGKWYYYYQLGERQWRENESSKMKNPTGRSHYGDLQFLHCMASQIGEPPEKTKHKFMTWLEVLYKLAQGEDDITADTIISDTKLAELFPYGALPARSQPIRRLLDPTSSFQQVDLRRRAIGSMFHFIQDSYAIGHTRRTLLNPQDKVSDNPLRFKPGTADSWGPIENFHTYSGQSQSHGAYDHDDDAVPDPHHLHNLDQFNGLIGCRNAVEKCIALMKLLQANTKWAEGGQQFFDQDVFAISPNATAANNQVWP